MLPKNGYQRKRNLFDPKSPQPFRLSRSRLENFLGCPRCFYLDRRLGVEPPGIPAFTLNSAVDALLKTEFDLYRRQKKPHPIMEQFGVKAIPFIHPQLDEWRENFKGVQFHHRETNLIVTGAVDDLWVDPSSGDVFVVDYKATSTEGRISLDQEYRQAYKRQMEIYQWLLRKNGLNVNAVGYFVYCNADKSKPLFSSKLEFSIEVIPYEGNDGWVEDAVLRAHRCLMGPRLPESAENCEYCQYRRLSFSMENPRSEASAQGELF